tara:strand:- start:31776 stop:32411 length:636 start_codon:yes stop_codon:yes gene_type:complete
MWYQVEDNRIISNMNNPRDLTIGNVQHPRGIFKSWSSDELKAIGIYGGVKIGSNKNTKLYKNTESVSYNQSTDTVEITITSTEKDVAGIKEQMISQNKAVVGSMLTTHDWQVIRELEGKPMSGPVKTYRDAIRSNGDTVEAAISAATTVAELEALSKPSQTSITEDVITSIVDEVGDPILDINGDPTTTTESVTTVTDHLAVLHNWPELGE